jgi:hypothetical protein
MRVLILKDPIIPDDVLGEVLDQFKEIYRDTAGIEVETTIRERDFSRVAFEPYWDGARGIVKSLVGDIAAGVLRQHGTRRFDHLVLMVDATHWIPSQDNIWGWNLAYAASGMETQQVRFDSVSEYRASRVANTLGTLFHETMHAHDQFVYRILGERIDPLAGVTSWDSDVVHGGAKQYEYIRHKENLDALAAIADPLRRAVRARLLQYQADAFGRGYRAAREGGAPPSLLDLLMQEFRRHLTAFIKSDQT